MGLFADWESSERDGTRRSLSTFRKGRLLTEKVANLKGPPALLSPRGMRRNKRTLEGRSAHAWLRTSNYIVTKCLQRDYCQRQHLAPPGDGCLDESFLYYQFYSTKGFAVDCRRRIFCERKWCSTRACCFTKVSDKMTRYRYEFREREKNVIPSF